MKRYNIQLLLFIILFFMQKQTGNLYIFIGTSVNLSFKNNWNQLRNCHQNKYILLVEKLVPYLIASREVVSPWSVCQSQTFNNIHQFKGRKQGYSY